LARMLTAALTIVLLFGAIAAAGWTAGSAQDTGPQATIQAQQTTIAELEGTVQARGKKINVQRTQIADLKTQVADYRSQVTPTTDASSGIQITVTDAIPLSDTFLIKEGTYRAGVDCTGNSYSVFLTLQDAPGHDNNIYEVLLFGEETPYSTSVLLNIFDSGEVIVEMKVIDGVNVSCTLTLGQ
jgi:hypothetical protein